MNPIVSTYELEKQFRLYDRDLFMRSRLIFAAALLLLLFLVGGCKSDTDPVDTGTVVHKGKSQAGKTSGRDFYFLEVKRKDGTTFSVRWSFSEGPGVWNRYKVGQRYP